MATDVRPLGGGYGDDLGAAARDVLHDQPAALVVADLGDQGGRHLEPGQPDGDVERGTARGLGGVAVVVHHDVDERLTGDDDHGCAAAQWSKSTSA